MTKVKVEVTNAVVDDKVHGETLTLDQKDAERLQSIGYVKIIEEKETKKKGKD